MSSCFFVPYIQQPTRVVDSSATLIDNMSSVEFATVSGNLLCQPADHLLKFLVLKDSGYLTDQNMHKYSIVVIDFSITMNLKTKLIK